ncbi:hypothetical protein Tco_0910017 [Tanacetum coccineum]|uniref:RNA-directed DNA polymerase, eukaryota n=1 Tax=Tanacetum coccineum TaxID=301880 RepID=A0ABQ5CTE3_9ASTR
MGTTSHYEEVESQPALVLDESCLNQSDMSIALMGKVKTFDSLSNLKSVLAKEGFDKITLKYMGGLWYVRKEDLMDRPTFVEEEENESEYDEMVSNEGDHEENGNNPNSVVNDSDIDEVPDTIFENSKSQNLSEAGCNVEQKHPQSEDPFNLYDLLNKKNNKSNGGSSSDSNLKYPPGFTPSVADEDKREDLYVSGDENEIRSKYVQVEVISPCEKEKEQNRNNGWHNDIHKPVYSGGSILQVMEDMVKVGKTMGYNMEGCINNIEEIIKSQGVNDEGFDDFVKTTWKEAQVNDHNAMRKFMNKLKLLKRKIREWTKDKRANTNNNKKILKEQLAEIDSLLDKGEGNVETLNNRADIFNSLQDIDKLESIELAQKAKIKWGIEGDENTKYYHAT